MRLPTFDDILAARARLAGVAHRTPVLTSRQLDARVGARVFLKAEHLQRIGAFKFRGGYNALAAMAPEDRARGVVAFSSGNHAQAVALAARLFGVPATIVMPHNAPASKLAATEGYGARVVRYDPSEASREVLARQLVAETGATLVPPFDHPDVIAGQASGGWSRRSATTSRGRSTPGRWWRCPACRRRSRTGRGRSRRASSRWP